MEKIKEFFSKFKINRLNKKLIRGVLIIVFVILVSYFIISSIITGNHNRTCNELREEILAATDIYMSENNLLPTLNGTSSTMALSDLYISSGGRQLCLHVPGYDNQPEASAGI